jgi:hypothetical protein
MRPFRHPRVRIGFLERPRDVFVQQENQTCGVAFNRLPIFHLGATPLAPQAARQTSPGIAHPPSRLCPPHLRQDLPRRYWALSPFALSPSLAASYAISVRQASGLPAASSRFHPTVDTLAVRLTIPPTGFVGDFHPQVNAPCRAHTKKPNQLANWLGFLKKTKQVTKQRS